jgi:pimeloyl-ACP methyl ester carboxylesterase
MALPALVLVHGGGLAADSWDLTVEEIHQLAPELTVLALDMPGRRNKPGDLREMTIADYGHAHKLHGRYSGRRV